MDIFAVNLADNVTAAITICKNWTGRDLYSAAGSGHALKEGCFELSFEGEKIELGDEITKVGLHAGAVVEVSLSGKEKAVMELRGIGVVGVTAQSMRTHPVGEWRVDLLGYLDMWRVAIGNGDGWCGAAESVTLKILKENVTFDRMSVIRYLAVHQCKLTEIARHLVQQPDPATAPLLDFIMSTETPRMDTVQDLIERCALPVQVATISKYFDLMSRVYLPSFTQGVGGHSILTSRVSAVVLESVLSNGENREGFLRLQNSSNPWLFYTKYAVSGQSNDTVGYYSVLKNLGVDTEVCDPDGTTPLMHLASHGARLVDEITDVKHCGKLNKRGWSVLTYAVRCGTTRVSVIEDLLKCSNPLQVDEQGNNLYHHATLTSVLSKLLHEVSLSVDTDNYHGVTPAEKFIRRQKTSLVQECVAWCVDPRKYIDTSIRCCASEEMFKLLISRFEFTKDRAREAMGLAITHGASAVYNSLCKLGCGLPGPGELTGDEKRVIVEHPKGSTTGKYLLRRGDGERQLVLFDFICEMTCVTKEFFTAYNVTLLTRTPRGSQTPLMLMARHCPASVLVVYLEYVKDHNLAAHLRVKDVDGHTAADIAKMAGHDDVAALLQPMK